MRKLAALPLTPRDTKLKTGMKRTPLLRKKSLRQYHEEKIKREAKDKARKAVDRDFGKRTPLKKIAKSQRRRLTEYLRDSRLWLLDHPLCEICLARQRDGENVRINPATECHHSRGRAGRLLNDSRFWVSSCFPCRDFPHANPRRARELGLLASPAEYNVFPAGEK